MLLLKIKLSSFKFFKTHGNLKGDSDEENIFSVFSDYNRQRLQFDYDEKGEAC